MVNINLQSVNPSQNQGHYLFDGASIGVDNDDDKSQKSASRPRRKIIRDPKFSKKDSSPNPAFGHNDDFASRINKTAGKSGGYYHEGEFEESPEMQKVFSGSNKGGSLLNSMFINSDQMMKSPNYEGNRHSGGHNNSPDVMAFNSMRSDYETNLKLKVVRVQENNSESESSDSEEEKQAQDLRKQRQRERIGSATSRYIDKTGQVNDIILETEESHQSSPEDEGKKRKLRASQFEESKDELLGKNDTKFQSHNMREHASMSLRVHTQKLSIVERVPNQIESPMFSPGAFKLYNEMPEKSFSMAQRQD